MSSLDDKLAQLPTSAGVYFHKSSSGEILYIGKAANLRNRVRQYFHKNKALEPKTSLLVREIADTDWLELETEADALFLEAELVRRYRPRYNILLRDDKSMQYVRIDYKSDYPTVRLVRRPLDDSAYYFGPYISGVPIKRALKHLRRAFPYATAVPVNQKRVSLHYHLGLDPGLEEGKTSLPDYRANLRKLMQYLRGERATLTRQVEKEMKAAAASRDFEKATQLRNQLFAMHELSRQVLFSDRERVDISKDHAIVEMCQLLGLQSPPRRIEGFDVSHMQGTDNAASMVVFVNGAPDKTAYRKFKMRLPGNDDVGHVRETLRRRLREENLRKWGRPDLILIDGGKGQLRAALEARDEAGQGMPVLGLAKRLEQILVHRTMSLPGGDISAVKQNAEDQSIYTADSPEFLTLRLPADSNLVKLLQRIRDESHRFAVAYHSTLKRQRHISSLLDEIPGVGPLTKKKLVKSFGSVKAIAAASESEVTKAVGPKKARLIRQYLSPESSANV